MVGLVLGFSGIMHGAGALAQGTVYATSGADRGVAGVARLQAQLAQQKDRLDNASTCANAGQLYGPNFAGNKDGDDCLTDLAVQAGGGVNVQNGLNVAGGAIITGNSSFSNNLLITGTTESDGRVFADDGVHVRGDWVRVDGNNGLYFETHTGGWHMTDGSWIRAYNDKGIYTGGDIRAEGQIQISGNIFGPPPTCNPTTEKLRWTGTAWECAAETAGGSGTGEVDPKVGSLVNGRLCRSNGSQVLCDQSYPASHAWVIPPSCGGGYKLRWTGSTWECLSDSESDPQVGSLQNGKWCTSNGSSVNCTSDPPSGGGGGIFFMCGHTGGGTPCAEARMNNGQGTANYRAINCRRSNGDSVLGSLFYQGSVWKYYTTALSNCLDNTVLVAKIN
ncbi:MAG: shufflon system plasmid conjugative transfer pilus tip adhesin PilV [Alphaproteobacteria bacterium]